MKNETKAEKIIRKEIEQYSILKPTSMAKDIIKALKEANLISSNTVLNADAKGYKEKYEKCIAVIKRFDAGIIGMYDL